MKSHLPSPGDGVLNGRPLHATEAHFVPTPPSEGLHHRDTRARIGVYDCLYVALAERDGCELLTADDRLVRVLRPLYPALTPLASLR